MHRLPDDGRLHKPPCPPCLSYPLGGAGAGDAGADASGLGLGDGVSRVSSRSLHHGTDHLDRFMDLID
jgi:hypothetical protein